MVKRSTSKGLKLYIGKCMSGYNVDGTLNWTHKIIDVGRADPTKYKRGTVSARLDSGDRVIGDRKWFVRQVHECGRTGRFN